MNREILQKINNLAKFIFSEEEINQFNLYIKFELLNDARLYIDNKLEEIELLKSLDEDNQELLSQYKQCDELLDVIIGTIVNEDAYEEGKQFKSNIR